MVESSMDDSPHWRAALDGEARGRVEARAAEGRLADALRLRRESRQNTRIREYETLARVGAAGSALVLHLAQDFVAAPFFDQLVVLEPFLEREPGEERDRADRQE